MEMIKEHQSMLVSFDEVLDLCVMGRRYPEFLSFRGLSDFCDGFVIAECHSTGVKDLQGYLKGFGLDCLMPRKLTGLNKYFV